MLDSHRFDSHRRRQVARVGCFWSASFMLMMAIGGGLTRSAAADPPLLAGAAVVDVSPIRFPVAVNGGMTAGSASEVNSPVNARAIVLGQGDERVALVVVDSCMLPRDLCDQIKAMASSATGISPDRMMISATHTHSAPAAMSCLGTDADPEYQGYLRIKVSEAIEAANKNLEPARVGFGSIDAAHYMAVRRWIRRPDRLAADPFGNQTVRANMHAGRNWDDVTGPSGPEDPDLTLISLESLDGHPIAVLANLSMHYFSGFKPISADYFGLFSDGLADHLASRARPNRPVVGIMSHGCSGDIWRMDYSKQTPPEFETIKAADYVEGLLGLATTALEAVQYDESPRLVMAEKRFRLDYRVPDAQRLEWAQRIVEQMGDRLPKTTEEVYAREQIFLHEAQSTEVVIQAIRIGEIGIATTPNETYALTGLKLKHQSPLPQTMVIELANGGDGYIPPPEQHVLGGYNTWPARSAGLEVEAEPKIAEAALGLLEQIAGQSRRPYRQPLGPEAQRLLAQRPLAYWRMEEFAGPRARDASGNDRDGLYETGVVFFLEGPDPARFTDANTVNRSAHFAGGRMRARIGQLPADYSVSLWVWNGMPTDGRPVTGWVYSRGTDYARPAGTEQLGLGGTDGPEGKLILQVGDGPVIAGKQSLERWTWHHVRLVREGRSLRVYLDGATEPEIDVTADSDPVAWADELFFGGSSRGDHSWEGRLDEIAVLPGAAR